VDDSACPEHTSGQGDAISKDSAMPAEATPPLETEDLKERCELISSRVLHLARKLEGNAELGKNMHGAPDAATREMRKSVFDTLHEVNFLVLREDERVERDSARLKEILTTHDFGESDAAD